MRADQQLAVFNDAQAYSWCVHERNLPEDPTPLVSYRLEVNLASGVVQAVLAIDGVVMVIAQLGLAN